MSHDSRRGCTHTVKKIVSVRTVEKDKEHLYCKGHRKRYLAGGCSVRDPTTPPTNKVATSSEQGDPRPPERGNFEEDEKTSKRIQCPFCSMDIVVGTTCCSCGAGQPNLSQVRHEQAPTRIQAGSAYIQTQIRPQKLREASSTDKAEHSNSAARPRTIAIWPVQKCRT